MYPITQVEVGINSTHIENPKQIMGIVVRGHLVATTSRHYKLVQHKEAFEPIFKGLQNTGTPYNFALFQTDTKAFLKVFVDEIKDNGEGIKLGFEARNSIDGRNAITYLMKSQKVERSTVIEVVGLRLACKNGMKVRVPLAEAEELKIEIKTLEKIKELLTMASRIVHMGKVEEKIKAVQYVVEAMTLLKEPVALIIEKAKKKPVGEVLAKKLIAKYIGKRMATDIEYRFKENEEPTLWGLYNAITFVASHGVTVPTMNGLIEKSADLLEQEVFVKKGSK